MGTALFETCYPSIPVVLYGGNFVTHTHTPKEGGDIWQCPEIFLVITTRDVVSIQ